LSSINLELQKTPTVWVATIKVEISGAVSLDRHEKILSHACQVIQMSGQRTVAIVMNAKNLESATCVPRVVRVARCVSWVVRSQAEPGNEALPGDAAPGDTAEIDYLITNAPAEKATAKWIVTTY